MRRNREEREKEEKAAGVKEGRGGRGAEAVGRWEEERGKKKKTLASKTRAFAMYVGGKQTGNGWRGRRPWLTLQTRWLGKA